MLGWVITDQGGGQYVHEREGGISPASKQTGNALRCSQIDVWRGRVEARNNNNVRRVRPRSLRAGFPISAPALTALTRLDPAVGSLQLQSPPNSPEQRI